ARSHPAPLGRLAARYRPLPEISFALIRRPPRSTLSPSTTLFRSRRSRTGGAPVTTERLEEALRAAAAHLLPELTFDDGDLRAARSEEHTSELQSRENLVCRLLLEKKNDADVRDQLAKTWAHQTDV